MEQKKFHYDINDLISRYPDLTECKESIIQAFEILKDCFKSGHKLLIAGNGGSCSDSEHIVGELMKGFKDNRKLSNDEAKKFIEIDPISGKELANKLQWGFPCISLTNHQSLNTAFTNDVENGGLLTYAQQLNVLGNSGDVFLALSTSGNSKNIIYASIVAKAKGLKVIGMTGQNGGKLNDYSDAIIKVPTNETFMVQEFHLPIYHCLCLMLEEM